MSTNALFPREIMQTIKVFHLGTGDGAQAFSGTADETLIGAVLPLSAHRKIELMGDATYTKELYLDDNADVREGDKITIGSDEYRVMHVDTHDYGGHPHKDAILATVKP